MQIINNQLSDIATGYNRIRQAEVDLQNKWRPVLLENYTGQRANYDEQLSQYNQQRADFSRRMRLGIWLASTLLVMGLIVLPGLILVNELGDFRGPLFCFAPILILGGLTGWAIIVILWIWQRDQVKPSPPGNPLKSGVIPPLFPQWKQALIGELPTKKTHPGATGEYRFISRLLTMNEDYYILYKIHQRQEEQIDLILVGLKGIWVFEVKYLDGLIRWRDGLWTQIQPVGKLKRKASKEIRRADRPFEEQWQRSANDVKGTITNSLLDSNNRSPDIAHVRGGIVFTHPKGRYDIPEGCPFNWGVIPFWLEKLGTVPDLPGMTEEIIFLAIDALLEQHHRVLKVDLTYSMLEYAGLIIQNAEEKIKSSIETS